MRAILSTSDAALNAVASSEIIFSGHSLLAQNFLKVFINVSIERFCTVLRGSGLVVKRVKKNPNFVMSIISLNN